MVGTVFGWGGTVARAHSGRRRLVATVLYAVVLLLASMAFAAGLVVRTGIGSQWDAAVRRGPGPHVVLTASSEAALNQIAGDPRVVEAGPRALKLHDTVLRLSGPQRAGGAVRGSAPEASTFPVNALLVPTIGAERPPGLLVSGRWLASGAGNEVVLDVGVARTTGRRTGDSVEIARGTHRGKFLIVGTAIDLGNCLLPLCDPGAVWLGPEAQRDLGEPSYSAWVQGFRLNSPDDAEALGIDAWKQHGVQIRTVLTADEVRNSSP